VAPVAPALPSASQPAVVAPALVLPVAPVALRFRRRCSAARCRPAGHRAGDHGGCAHPARRHSVVTDRCRNPWLHRRLPVAVVPRDISLAGGGETLDATLDASDATTATQPTTALLPSAAGLPATARSHALGVSGQNFSQFALLASFIGLLAVLARLVYASPAPAPSFVTLPVPVPPPRF